MRVTVRIVAALSLLCGVASTCWAGDNDAAAIISKANKAHFPKGTDTKNQAVRTKNKGTLHIMGIKVEFIQDIAIQAPMFKEVMELNVMDKKVMVTSVFNGKEAWIRAGDKDVPVNDAILEAFKEASYTMGLMQGVFQKDKSIKFAVIGEVQVKGKPAIGLIISKEGKKDVSLFCDKETGLISKVELRTRDLMSGQEITEERFITEYQEVSGRKVAKKIEVQRDGKQFMEAEVLEVQILEKLDASEFAQPK